MEKQKALLLVDSHTSRDQEDFIRICKDENIDILTFPSHTTHLLQPLDLTVCGSFKKNLNKYTEDNKQITNLPDIIRSVERALHFATYRRTI